ncbi:MAG: hypothetical protein IJ805_00945 [Lachnospiraceae bacterium]|nr:hypothetical protein [Lachnospiraceae bacterium]
MEIGYYGSGQKDIKPVNDIYPGIGDPDELFETLLKLWCSDTCASWLRDKWSDKNPALGQCSISSFIAQDIFGGKVYGILRPAGNYHCYNVIDGKTFDLTSSQFGDEVLSYEGNPEQLKEVHLKDKDKERRYAVLTELLRDYCGGKEK